MNKPSSPPESGQHVIVAMLFISLMFFILGFVTWLNGSLIPFLKIICDLTTFQALWVTFAFYIAYTVMAMPSAFVLSRIGYKKGMAAGLGVMAVGALLFIPAAKSGLYLVFLVALFTLATGMTLMQTAINPYIVCIGDRESAAMRISIMGLFNKGAGIVVPLVFTALILSGIDQYSETSMAALDVAARTALKSELANRLVFPYIVMAAGLFVFMIVILFSSLPELRDEEEESTEKVEKYGVLKFPNLVLGAITLFAYVGVEVIAGDTIGLYGRQLGLQNFAVLTSYTMGFMVIGYLVGVVAIPRFLTQKNALLMCGLTGILFTIGVMVSSPESHQMSTVMFGWLGITTIPDSVLYLAMLGFANALVWPSIWPLALEGLGKYTANGSALLIMGIAGGAILPMVYGYVADLTGLQSAYWVMLPCYLLILFYAIKGHSMKSWGSNDKVPNGIAAKQ